jgi:hypothetical protein
VPKAKHKVKEQVKQHTIVERKVIPQSTKARGVQLKGFDNPKPDGGYEKF